METKLRVGDGVFTIIIKSSISGGRILNCITSASESARDLLDATLASGVTVTLDDMKFEYIVTEYSLNANSSVTDLVLTRIDASDAPIRSSKPTKPQQPTVPIQFVWHDGCLYHESDCRNMGMGLEENCAVEQIGAVLYVRSKK